MVIHFDINLDEYSLYVHVKSQPTIVCGDHMGWKWVEKWAPCRIVREFHNGAMLIAHMDLI